MNNSTERALLFRHNTKLRHCDCGAPAFKRSRSGRVCLNCDKIEQMMYTGHGKAHCVYDWAVGREFNPLHKYVEVFGISYT
jgi:hypothetical protein